MSDGKAVGSAPIQEHDVTGRQRIEVSAQTAAEWFAKRNPSNVPKILPEVHSP